MKRLAYISVMCLVTSAQGQNLVPNGSFENPTECPHMWGRLNLVGWNMGFNSPDYFNACDTSKTVGVPESNMGFQYAADGDGYAGMSTSAIGGVPWYREIIATQLTEPLIPGVPICLSFQTAMGGFGNDFASSTIYSCKGLGIHFFTQLPVDWQTYLYPNSAALSIQEVPTDTSRWYYVSGSYTPDSAYEFIAIGNFFADSLSALTLIDSIGIGGDDVAYAFVDDIRASFDLSYCTSGVNGSVNGQERFVAFPVPCEGDLYVSVPAIQEGACQYHVFDPVGTVVMEGEQRIADDQLHLNIGTLAEGHYFLRIMDPRGGFHNVRIVHVSP